MSIQNFKILRQIGEGSYSQVHLVERLSDTQTYALKKVNMQELSQKEKENALNEVRILASVQHPNIIAFKEAFIDDSSQSLCLVMENADKGDLLAEVKKLQKEGSLMEEERIWRIITHTLRGLQALHSLKILHRDIKSANIFLCQEGEVAKLGDMNIAKVLEKNLLHTQTGTPYYASPEVWRELPYNHKSDIWSLGCVFYEMVCLKLPFKSRTMEGLFKKVLDGKYPRIPGIYSKGLSKLLKSMLQIQSHLRPNCDKILEMPVVHEKLLKYVPEHFQSKQSNILLKSIHMPKNLMFLTDNLPSANYEKSKLPGDYLLSDVKPKRNTFQSDIERYPLSKRFQSLQRGSLYRKNYDCPESIQSQKVECRDDQSKDSFSQNRAQSYQNEFDCQTLETKVEEPTDSQREQIEEVTHTKNNNQMMKGTIAKKGNRKIKRIKKVVLDPLEQKEELENKGSPPQRVIMEHGVYDQIHNHSVQTRSNQIQHNYVNGNLGPRAQSVMHANSHFKQQSESRQSLIHKVLRGHTTNRQLSLTHDQQQSRLPQISNTSQTYINKPSAGYYTSHKLENSTSQVYEPNPADRYLQSISKPEIGINRDRFLSVSGIQRCQNHVVRDRIINQKDKLTQVPFNYNDGVSFQPSRQLNQYQYKQYSLGIGSKVGYFGRHIPQF